MAKRPDMVLAGFFMPKLRNAPLLLALPMFLSPLALAQTSGGETQGNGMVSSTATAVAAPVVANPTQTASSEVVKRAWTISPRITLGETLTDNVALRSVNKRSDQITEISPGIRISGESARLKGYFDYAMREFLYAQGSNSRSSQTLNTFGRLEAVENHLFVDFTGGIAQQTISAFGAQSPSASSINSNQTETSTYRISPYWRGRFGSIAEYEIRYGASTTSSKSSLAANNETREWSANISGGNPRTALGWGLNASTQSYDYSRGRETESKIVRGNLSYMLFPSLKISVNAGTEENNFISTSNTRHSTSGFGFDWVPGPRTKLSFSRERRFFGESHQLLFEHRTPLSALRFSDSRSVTVMPNQVTSASVGNVYDLLYNQAASIEPDPIKRAALVNTFMQANGIPSNAQTITGFVNSGPLDQRRQDLSIALIGIRNTLTFFFSQSESSRLNTAVGIVDDLSTNTSVRQRGFNVNFSHRLSGLTTLNLMGSQQQTTSGSSSIETKLRMLNINLSTKIGAHTSASLGMRRVLFDSTTNPYTENALLGNLTMQY